MSHVETIDVIRELGNLGAGSTNNARLVLLVAAEFETPMPMSFIAERTGISRGAMTTLIDGLESSKLLKRTHNDGDRRRVLVGITPHGKQTIARAEKRAGVNQEEAA